MTNTKPQIQEDPIKPSRINDPKKHIQAYHIEIERNQWKEN